MDASLLPLFSEMKKLPSPIASQNYGKPCQNKGKPVQTEFPLSASKVVEFTLETEPLAKAVPSWENLKVAEREGFEPPVPCGTPDFESGAFDHSATSP
jgi:hypothetical protein